MNINAIYPTYQGEVNIGGIGAPVIFVRTQGCHLRCYKKTMGILCDTPEALEVDNTDNSKHMTTDEVIAEVIQIREKTGGVKLVCLSGGDPLYTSNKEELHDLLWKLGQENFTVSIETSGTLSFSEYAAYSWVHFVVDYKSKSAGLKSRFYDKDIRKLTSTDFIKFVLYDEADYQEFFEVVTVLKKQTEATIAVGLYWGGKLWYEKLINLLTVDKLLGQVVINMQAHKLITMYDKTDVSKIIIPKKI